VIGMAVVVGIGGCIAVARAQDRPGPAGAGSFAAGQGVRSGRSTSHHEPHGLARVERGVAIGAGVARNFAETRGSRIGSPQAVGICDATRRALIAVPRR
jgi:hypothetical protein